MSEVKEAYKMLHKHQQLQLTEHQQRLTLQGRVTITYQNQKSRIQTKTHTLNVLFLKLMIRSALAALSFLLKKCIFVKRTLHLQTAAEDQQKQNRNSANLLQV